MNAFQYVLSWFITNEKFNKVMDTFFLNSYTKWTLKLLKPQGAKGTLKILSSTFNLPVMKLNA